MSYRFTTVVYSAFLQPPVVLRWSGDFLVLAFPFECVAEENTVMQTMTGKIKPTAFHIIVLFLNWECDCTGLLLRLRVVRMVQGWWRSVTSRANRMGSATFHGEIFYSMSISPNTLLIADLESEDLKLWDLTLKKNFDWVLMELWGENQLTLFLQKLGWPDGLGT